MGGPVVCEDGYEYNAQKYGGACCPTPTPTPECEFKACEAGVSDWSMEDCCCVLRADKQCDSPVLVDVAGDGFALTDPAGGVRLLVRAP